MFLPGLDIYAEALIFAYEHPRHRLRIEGADASVEEENASCGDRLRAYVKIDGGKISEMSFEGSGCIISMGTAEMLCEFAKGKNVEDLLKFGKEDLVGLIMVNPGPVRMSCATLSLRAAKKALLAFEHRREDSSIKEL